MLGDDALACLKDLRRWIKLYDQRLNRLDVARCLAEANLVRGDLLEILASWPEDATEDRLKSKIALSCRKCSRYTMVVAADICSGGSGALDVAARDRG